MQTAVPAGTNLTLAHVVGCQCQMYLGYFQHFGAFIDTVSFYPLNCATNAQLDTLDSTKMHGDNEPQVT